MAFTSDGTPGLPMKRNGFTITELLAVIAIMGTLLALAGLAYNAWLQRYNLESQVRTMHVDLLGARAQALQKNTARFVTVAADGYTLAEDTNESGGNAPDAGDTSHPKKPLKFTSAWTGTILLDSRGLVSAPDKILFNTGGVSAAVDCIVFHTTRIRVGRYNGTDCISR